MWDVRGWNRLVIHDDPPLVAAREEFLSWLEDVPEPERSAWRQRLTSKHDTDHLSVRLELFLHHYFKGREWEIAIEPEVPDSPNRPDFIVSRNPDQIMIEARSVFDQKDVFQQDQRLAQLADQLGGKLSGSVIIHPLSDLPASLPRKLRSDIESRISSSPDGNLEFVVSGSHQGAPYSLKVMFVPGVEQEQGHHGVEGLIVPTRTLNLSEKVRDALKEKAGKYGRVHVPFIIAINGEGSFPLHVREECDALFGDRVWNIPRRGAGPVTESRNQNGFFTEVKDGKYRQERVSAVLVYRFKWLEDTHAHSCHIYHNPFAILSLDPNLFPGISQLVFDKKDTGNWLNGEPD